MHLTVTHQINGKKNKDTLFVFRYYYLAYGKYKNIFHGTNK